MTRRKRETTSEERALFHDTLKSATPHAPKPDKPAAAAPAKPSRKQASVQAGLDGRTAERLRRGQLEPEARIDLHGLTEAAAHRALSDFVRSAHRRGLRLVLVVTGKGAAPPAPDAPFDLELATRARGVLRTMTPRWLKERALAPLVAEIRSAHRRHGGGGALYVYLRKAQR